MISIDAINRIRRDRTHTEADYRTFAEARLLQRRLRAAVRRTDLGRGERQSLYRRLQRQRAQGFGPDLRWWIADYREYITTQCRWSARYV